MSTEAKKKAPRAADSYRAARRPAMIAAAKIKRRGRAGIARIQAKASDRNPPKLWVWKRAVPRAS